MKIKEGYLEGNLTKSECFAAKILELEQNMEFFNTLIKNAHPFLRLAENKKLLPLKTTVDEKLRLAYHEL